MHTGSSSAKAVLGRRRIAEARQPAATGARDRFHGQFRFLREDAQHTGLNAALVGIVMVVVRFKLFQEVSDLSSTWTPNGDSAPSFARKLFPMELRIKVLATSNPEVCPSHGKAVVAWPAKSYFVEDPLISRPLLSIVSASAASAFMDAILSIFGHLVWPMFLTMYLRR